MLKIFLPGLGDVLVVAGLEEVVVRQDGAAMISYVCEKERERERASRMEKKEERKVFFSHVIVAI